MSDEALQQLNETLDRIGATLDNLCGYCNGPIPPDSVSAYYCKDVCQQRWHENRSERPHQVYYRRDAAPYPGGPMEWAPGLVTVDPGPDLVRPGDVPAALGYPGGQFTATIYRRMSKAAWHLRLDDGHRYVGRDLNDRELGDEQSVAAAAQRTWQALERELTDERRAQPAASRGAVWVDPNGGGWLDVGYTDEGYNITIDEALSATPVERSRPGRTLQMTTAHERLADAVDASQLLWERGLRRALFRPARRWCLSCGESHPAPTTWPHGQCTGCRAPLPQASYELSPTLNGHTHLTLEVNGSRAVSVSTQPVDNALVGEIFHSLEGEVVRHLRQAQERVRYGGNQVRVNPNLHAQVRGVSWHVPVNRHVSVPLAPPATLSQHIERARQTMATFPETLSALRELMRRFLPHAVESQQGQVDRDPMAAEIRRRRERQGHTGPQERRRAPRRIDPPGRMR